MNLCSSVNRNVTERWLNDRASKTSTKKITTTKTTGKKSMSTKIVGKPSRTTTSLPFTITTKSKSSETLTSLFFTSTSKQPRTFTNGSFTNNTEASVASKKGKKITNNLWGKTRRKIFLDYLSIRSYLISIL